MSNTGPWCVFGATHSREAQRAYLFLNFFKNFDFSLLCPHLLCVHGGALVSSPPAPARGSLAAGFLETTAAPVLDSGIGQ